jgi:heterotetrameric sarcosine oxidase delta subunit
VLLIPCPWCGPRAELEFGYGGQASIAYPADPDALTDEEWAAYLFLRDNPRGELDERWVHTAGCRRWFRVRRNTATNEIAGSSPMSTHDVPAADSFRPDRLR